MTHTPKDRRDKRGNDSKKMIEAGRQRSEWRRPDSLELAGDKAKGECPSHAGTLTKLRHHRCPWRWRHKEGGWRKDWVKTPRYRSPDCSPYSGPLANSFSAIWSDSRAFPLLGVKDRSCKCHVKTKKSKWLFTRWPWSAETSHPPPPA